MEEGQKLKDTVTFNIYSEICVCIRAILVSFAFPWCVQIFLFPQSAKVCEAFYDCHWYNMSKNNARMIILCMARSQKPLCLTAGKFTLMCLSTLTDVS